MVKNVHGGDRAVRLVIAALAAYFATMNDGAVQIILWVVAAIMVLTAALGFCPLYRLFGVSTCKVKK
ncbi:YgaP family membrane protein [Corynebacterium sp. H78]|uniref:YgaP family membrane protein n=1 Tax=Corynebacterium sp. H78 TaxID=3133417 RepID=UPI0030B747B9